MNAYLSAFQKYAQFAGRSTRREYWIFVLVNFVVSVVISFFDGGITTEHVGWLSAIYALVVLLPSLALAARRLHDIGRTGWWLLLGLVPFIGWIVLLIFACFPSGPDNEYGPRPAGVGPA